jgi:hypothetical protein
MVIIKDKIEKVNERKRNKLPLCAPSIFLPAAKEYNNQISKRRFEDWPPWCSGVR